MNLAAILVTGLFAGGVSCAAVQGGLLTGLITRQQAARAETTQPHPHPHRAVGVRDDVTPASTWRSRLGDDLAPIAGFLAGKLVAYTVLGAALGALGGAVQLSIAVRTALQIGAGLLVITFGLAQLGVPGFRNIVVEPPAPWTRLVRTRARSQSAVAPTILGTFTVLIPCGVTLSVEALALTSGSAAAGAATMAVFILGTSPLFALLGYAARKAATMWQGRLAFATGLAVLAMGLYTLNGGLELAGSPLAASRLPQTLGITQPATDSSTVTTAQGQQHVVVTVHSDGYSPRNAAVHAGLPTTLVVHSDDISGCVRGLEIAGREILLPATGDTTVDLGVLEPGQMDYSCSMGMYTGTITVG